MIDKLYRIHRSGEGVVDGDYTAQVYAERALKEWKRRYPKDTFTIVEVSDEDLIDWSGLITTGRGEGKNE